MQINLPHIGNQRLPSARQTTDGWEPDILPQPPKDSASQPETSQLGSDAVWAHGKYVEKFGADTLDHLLPNALHR